MIRQLVAAGVVVIASGGGGVPVVDDGPRLAPREGVVDKDLAAAILARDVDAPTLLILTDVDHVQRGFGTEDVEPIRRMTTSEAGRSWTPGSSRRARWARRSRPPCGSSSRAVAVP